MEKETNAVDLLKLLFAICVVGIHTQVLDQFSERTNWYITHLLFRLAVPFFFIASGYFFGKKFLLVADDVKKRRGICRQYIFRNTPMFLFWSTIGLIWYFIVLLSERSNHILLRMIRTAVFYPRGAMWFLAASMVAVLLIGLLWDHKIILILLSGGGIVLH